MAIACGLPGLACLRPTGGGELARHMCIAIPGIVSASSQHASGRRRVQERKACAFGTASAYADAVVLFAEKKERKTVLDTSLILF